MNTTDKNFEDALKGLPEQKLSRQADRHILKMIRQRAKELDGKVSISMSMWHSLTRLVAVPVAFALLITSTGAYGFYSPSVVQGDLLYPVKSELESIFYPQNGESEERIVYHLWLSERRFAEAEEIVDRKDGQFVSFVQNVRADEDDVSSLDKILISTLERANQNVDLAFLIVDEIEDVEKFRVISDRIRRSVAKQKVFLDKSAPILAKVKMGTGSANGNIKRMIAFRESMLDEFDDELGRARLEGRKKIVMRARDKRKIVVLDREKMRKNRLLFRALEIHDRKFKRALAGEPRDFEKDLIAKVDELTEFPERVLETAFDADRAIEIREESMALETLVMEIDEIAAEFSNLEKIFDREEIEIDVTDLESDMPDVEDELIVAGQSDAEILSDDELIDMEMAELETQPTPVTTFFEKIFETEKPAVDEPVEEKELTRCEKKAIEYCEDEEGDCYDEVLERCEQREAEEASSTDSDILNEDGTTDDSPPASAPRQ